MMLPPGKSASIEIAPGAAAVATALIAIATTSQPGTRPRPGNNPID